MDTREYFAEMLASEPTPYTPPTHPPSQKVLANRIGSALQDYEYKLMVSSIPGLESNGVLDQLEQKECEMLRRIIATLKSLQEPTDAWELFDE